MGNGKTDSLKKPDGYWHGRLTITAIPIAFCIGAIISIPVWSQIYGAMWAALGCALGLIIDPDLDQEMVSSSEWRVINFFGLKWIKDPGLRMLTAPIRWVGYLVGASWVGLWMPYALMMPHRSPFSHWPVLGTAIRIGYLCAIVMTWLLAFHLILGYPIPWQRLVDLLFSKEILFLFIGLCVSDFTHFGRDWWGWRI